MTTRGNSDKTAKKGRPMKATVDITTQRDAERRR